ncbi:LysR family transcriptional regulator [Pseudomonas fluorescens]|uniref:LysR family transcriptional regulator n=1 Tax=Pseudomonas fluorescens TaxID=294 RepID=A0A327N6W1_PSEFL|nr:LysR substrate-binding domain-containing protein [Pseudomonas fluorescens]RAI70891.1 LysR family transcriptional regulator [Pseudomonas fluorescens]
MDFIQKLQVFTAVVEFQSFARAAESLRLTRPSVTIAINELEKEVGVRLLHRTTRRTTLTGDGRVYLDQARLTLSAVDEARSFFNAYIAEPSGKLRVDMSNSIARSVIIPRISRFLALYPKVELALGVSDQQVDLVAEAVDCVLRVGELASTSLVSRLVHRTPTVTCASPDYLKEHGTPQSLEDLENHVGIVYFHGRNRKVKEWQFTIEGKSQSIRMKPALMINDHDACVECALKGLGLAQIGSIGIQNELAAGHLVPVLSHLDAGTMPVSILYPARNHLPPKVRAFLDWTISIFAEYAEDQARGSNKAN